MMTSGVVPDRSLERISLRVESAVLQVQVESGSLAQSPHWQSSLLKRACSTGSLISTEPACKDELDCPKARAGVSATIKPKRSEDVSPPARRRYDQPRASWTATSGHIDTTAPRMSTRTPAQIQETNGFTCTWNVATLVSGLTIPTTT